MELLSFNFESFFRLFLSYLHSFFKYLNVYVVVFLKYITLASFGLLFSPNYKMALFKKIEKNKITCVRKTKVV